MPYLVIHAEHDGDDFTKRTVIGGEDTDQEIVNITGATLKPEYKSSAKYYASPYKAQHILKLLENKGYIVIASCMIKDIVFWTLRKPTDSNTN